MEFKLGELFSGPGGIAAGARNSVLEPINGKTTSYFKHLKVVLGAKDRSKCGALAPADGLYFMKVKY